VTGTVDEGQPGRRASPRLRPGLARMWRALVDRLLRALDRLRLPGATVLPVAGAVVGLYGGLAAGVFANLIGVVSGVVFGWPQMVDIARRGSETRGALRDSLANAHWHPEYLVIGVPLALCALGLTRLIRAGGARDVVRRRLQVLALLVLGALALYYPLVAMAAINAVFGHGGDLLSVLHTLPAWARILVPAAGGALVGRLLEKDPGTRGHGVPEVVAAVQQNPEGLTARRGLRKLLASALTIGTGGSAGREGPIVYGGAAFGSAVGRTLGFTRRELSVLLAAGAGAGISASFNTPIGGAVFALEIILRDFGLLSFSPIFLASVTATLVARGVMGNAAMLDRVAYQIQSGWEILAYAALGLLMGMLAYAFVRLLHWSEELFAGQRHGGLSRWLGRRRLPTRAAIGGLVVGALGLLSPTVWGVGHESLNLATAQKLSLTVLVMACALKLIASCITLGSGGSGGTFFAAVVIGGKGGRSVRRAPAPGAARRGPALWRVRPRRDGRVRGRLHPRTAHRIDDHVRAGREHLGHPPADGDLHRGLGALPRPGGAELAARALRGGRAPQDAGRRGDGALSGRARGHAAPRAVRPAGLLRIGRASRPRRARPAGGPGAGGGSA
jgi:CIC family chloride channel protein